MRVLPRDPYFVIVKTNNHHSKGSLQKHDQETYTIVETHILGLQVGYGNP